MRAEQRRERLAAEEAVAQRQQLVASGIPRAGRRRATASRMPSSSNSSRMAASQYGSASSGVSPSPPAPSVWSAGSARPATSASPGSSTPPGNACTPGNVMLPWRSSIRTETDRRRRLVAQEDDRARRQRLDGSRGHARHSERARRGPIAAFADPAGAHRKITPPMIEVRDVSRLYRRGVDLVHALEHVTLDIPAGRFVALMGPSGSGKSTLMNLLAGLDRPDSGEVIVVGQALVGARRGRARDWRSRHVGLVFQFYNLLPGAVGGRERRAAAPADRPAARAIDGGAREIALRRSACRIAPPSAVGALGRRAAARRDRARDRHRSGPARRRRADGRPRREERRRDPDAAPRAEPRLREDDRHGDARPARRGVRRQRDPAQQGRASRTAARAAIA